MKTRKPDKPFYGKVDGKPIGRSEARHLTIVALRAWSDRTSRRDLVAKYRAIADSIERAK